MMLYSFPANYYPVWKAFPYLPIATIFIIRKPIKPTPKLTIQTDLVPAKSYLYDSQIWWTPRK